MSKKITLIIAVAVMLVAVTSAYGYSERWDAHFFATGTITYDDTVYTYTGSGCVVGSYIYAWTHNAYIDSITGANLDTPTAVFIHDDAIDSLDDTLYIEIVDYGSYKKLLGWKETDTLGTKEGDGTWTGYCTNKNFYVRGTWDTGIALDTKYFNYNLTPPVGNGDWDITWSSADATGYGTWEMIRGSYSP